MTGEIFLIVSENIALGLLALAMALTLFRLLRGPTLGDRILSLDMLTVLTISLIAVLALRTGVSLLLDIALALCLLGFVTTIALARYLLTRGTTAGTSPAGGNRI